MNGFGFSAAIFVLILAGVILANRELNPLGRSTLVLVTLLVGACGATIIEASFTNTVVLLVLVLALAGDSFFVANPVAWERWMAQVVAMAAAPGRVFWMGHRVLSAVRGHGSGWARTIFSAAFLAVPTFVLALIFGGLLAAGNAVFGNWTGQVFGWIWNRIWEFLDLPRMMLWLLIAFLVLPLLHPSRLGENRCGWLARLPRLPQIVSTRAAVVSSSLTLIVLNLLFVVANVADALFLWHGSPMPSGVEFKGYVHQGFATLIFTVLLTAVVLTAIFQQQVAVAGRRFLQVLALVWIAQNIFLLTSCALRLKKYVDDSQLTVARLSCLIFLTLVAVGFVLLTIKIVRNCSIAWLMGRCLLACFVTFYLTQFLDLAGWAENYNVSRYEREHDHKIDTWKLYEAGPAGWPAAARAHKMDPMITVLNEDPNRGQVTKDDFHLAQFDATHWREFSLRAWWNRAALEEK